MECTYLQEVDIGTEKDLSTFLESLIYDSKLWYNLLNDKLSSMANKRVMGPC